MSSPHLHGPSTRAPGDRRRRLPLWVFVLGFVLVPVVEIWSIVQVGQVVGPWWTILLLIGTGVLGSWLVRREGARTWRALREASREGRMPHQEVADGILVLVGGAMMVLPGFVSDVLGLLLLLPVTRPVGRKVLARGIARRMDAAYVAVPPHLADQFGRDRFGGGAPPRPDADDVVRGEVVDP